MILSIDIGRRNLGWAVGNEESLEFGLYDLDGEKNKYLSILARTERIHNFLKSLFEKYNIETVIIEKQVNKNTVAMELMYLFVSAVYFYCKKVILYQPVKKFTTLAIKYSTKNKEHKKLVVDIVQNYLEKYNPEAYEEFKGYRKKDDISDAILMMLTYMYKTDKEELLKIKGPLPF